MSDAMSSTKVSSSQLTSLHNTDWILERKRGDVWKQTHGRNSAGNPQLCFIAQWETPPPAANEHVLSLPDESVCVEVAEQGVNCRFTPYLTWHYLGHLCMLLRPPSREASEKELPPAKLHAILCCLPCGNACCEERIPKWCSPFVSCVHSFLLSLPASCESQPRRMTVALCYSLHYIWSLCKGSLLWDDLYPPGWGDNSPRSCSAAAFYNYLWLY